MSESVGLPSFSDDVVQFYTTYVLYSTRNILGLVNFESRIDTANEEKAAQDTDRATKESKANRDNAHVRDVDEYW